MCRLWRFLKGAFHSRFLFTMEAATTATTTATATSTTDVTEDNGKGASGADETDIKKPEATKNIGPVINPELANKSNSKETVYKSPPDKTEPVNRPPETNLGNDLTETHGRDAPDTAENDVKKAKATINRDPVTNPGLANEDNPKEPINDPPPDMAEPINRPPKNNVESRKNAESSKNTNKRENKPKKLDFSKMPLNEKRSYYRCGKHYVTLNQIMPWPDYVKKNHYFFAKRGLLERDTEFTAENDCENRKVSLWQGDITCLEIDAIVNAANNSLRGGGGVDGCIHRAAGRGLLEECIKLHGCETGSAKITSGQKLPAKHVIHTVGPIGEKKELLESCYISCLTLMKEHELSSVAFCSISTGIYGYPNMKAARVALRTVKTWLENNKDWVGRIIFCVFLQDDLEVYQQLMLEYFPCTVEKKKEKMEESEDDTVPSEKEPKTNTTVGEKPHRSKGRGRGRGKHTKNTSEKKPNTLLSLATSSKGETKTNPSKVEGGSPNVGNKPGYAGKAGSSFDEDKDGNGHEENMDTLEGDKGDSATVGSGTPETKAEKKENKETTNNTKCMKTRPGGDLSGNNVADGAPENIGASEDGSKMSSADGSKPGHAGNGGSSIVDPEEMDTSESPTSDTAMVGNEIPETKSDKKESKEITNDDPADTKCVKTHPGGDISGDDGANGATDHRGSPEGESKISSTDAREVSQPESMETDEGSEETGASMEKHKSVMNDEKEGFREGEEGTIGDESNEGGWQVVKRKKKCDVKITSKV